MGSFIGHAIPGFFFIISGLWWLINGLRRFYLLQKFAKQKTHPIARIRSTSNRESLGSAILMNSNSVAFPFFVFGCVSRKPVEGIVKICCCSIGMIIESFGFLWHNEVMYQHFTMYGAFLFAGVVDIVLHVEKRKSFVKFPPNLDFYWHGLACFVEGVLFQYHLHGRTNLDVVIHTFLICLCYINGAVFIVEALANTFARKSAAHLNRNRQAVLTTLRGFVTIFHGVWFWQAGAILYPLVGKKMCATCHDKVMLIPIIFCWLLIACALVTGILIGSIGYYIAAATTSTVKSKSNFKTLDALKDAEEMVIFDSSVASNEDEADEERFSDATSEDLMAVPSLMKSGETAGKPATKTGLTGSKQNLFSIDEKVNDQA